MRRDSKYEPILIDTIIKYLLIHTKRVEKKLESIQPKIFTLFIDGWSDEIIHYVGVFPPLSRSEAARFSYRLLTFLLLGDEGPQSAREYVEFLTFNTQDVYRERLSNFAHIVADNCSTKKGIENFCIVPMIGCSSYIVILAIDDSMEGDVGLANRVTSSPQKLRNPTLSAKLFRICHLQFDTRNVARRSFTSDMSERFSRAPQHLCKLYTRI